MDLSATHMPCYQQSSAVLITTISTLLLVPAQRENDRGHTMAPASPLRTAGEALRAAKKSNIVAPSAYRS